MKKLLLTIIAIAIIAASCKKDMHTDPIKPGKNEVAKKYKVTYTVTDFSQTTGNILSRKAVRLVSKPGSKALATDTSALAQAVSSFYHIVYDATGKEIKRIHRFAGNTWEDYYHEDGADYEQMTPGLEHRTVTDPFNVLTDSLAAGNYTIVVTGSTQDIGINYWDINWSDYDIVKYLPFTEAKVYVGDALDEAVRPEEIYFGKAAITVGSENSTHNLTIKRTVGQLQLNIEDAIPSGIAKLAVTGIGNNTGFLFDKEMSIGHHSLSLQDEADLELASSNITSSDVGKTNFKLQTYITNISTPMTIIIKAYDASNKLIITKRIDNVRFYQNERTILTGKLFAPNTSLQQFTILLNQQWDPDITINF